MNYNDFIFDVECLSTIPESIVTEISIIAFRNDPNNVQPFEELIAKGKKFKISIADQKASGRHIMKSTIDWWKNQPIEARKNLKPAADDLTLNEAVDGMIQYFHENGLNKYQSKLWCRGMSFDIPIWISMLQQRFETKDTMLHEPIMFWNGRDVRTAIEAITLTPGLTMTPLPKGLLEGFVMHDSIHDCAKDILMLLYAQRYALGLEDAPEGDDIDPQTVKARS